MTHYCLNKYNSNGDQTKVESGNAVGGVLNRDNGGMGSGNTTYAWSSNKDNEISYSTLTSNSPTLYYGHKYLMHAYTDDTSVGHDTKFTWTSSGVVDAEVAAFEDVAYARRNVLAYYFYIRPTGTNKRIYVDIHSGITGDTERHKDVYTFRASQSRVIFDANGGTMFSASDVLLDENKYSFKLPSDRPKRTGYTFSGWYSNSSGTGGIDFGSSSSTSVSVSTLINNDLIGADGKCYIYAKWTAIPQYTLTVYKSPTDASVNKTIGTSSTTSSVSNGATFSVYQGYKYYADNNGTLYIYDADGNRAYTLLPVNTTGNTNYTFSKWTQTINGTTTDVPTTNTTVSSAVSLTAVFNGSYKFTISPTSNNGKTAINGFKITSRTNVYTDSACTSLAPTNTTYSSDSVFYVPISGTNSISINWPSGSTGTTDGSSPYYYSSNSSTSTIYNSSTGSSGSSMSISSGGLYLRPYDLSSSTTYYKKINYYNNTSSSDTSVYPDLVSSSSPTISFTTRSTTTQSKTGYTFDGWATGRNGSVSYQKGTSYSQSYSSGVLNLYAHWTVNTYTVTWKNWDGTTLETDSVAYGNTPVYYGSTPTRPSTAQYNYTFDGWYPTISTVTGNQTYTAQFTTSEVGYTITVNVGSGASGGGTVSPSGTVRRSYSNPYAQLTATPNMGNKFIKWRLNGSDIPSGGSIDPTSATINVDLSQYDGSTFTAIFEQLPNLTYTWYTSSATQESVNGNILYSGARIARTTWTEAGTSKPSVTSVGPTLIIGQTYYFALKDQNNHAITEMYIYNKSGCDVSLSTFGGDATSVQMAITPTSGASECYVQVILRTAAEGYMGYGYVLRTSSTAYTYTFNANGGSFTGIRNTSVKCPPNSTLYTPSGTYVTNTSGQNLNCWNTQADYTGTMVPAGTSVVVSTDRTLYAQWGEIYTLTYTNNGHGTYQGSISGTPPITSRVNSDMYYIELGTGDNKNELYVKYLSTGSTYYSTTAVPTGRYKFHHWDCITGEIDQDQTITAYFYPELELYYMLNDGTDTVWMKDIYYEGAESHDFTVTDEIPTRAGYTFVGWSSTYTSTTAEYHAGDTITVSMSNTPVFIHAVWAISYSIQFLTHPPEVYSYPNQNILSNTTWEISNDLISFSSGQSCSRASVSGYDFVKWVCSQGTGTSEKPYTYIYDNAYDITDYFPADRVNFVKVGAMITIISTVHDNEPYFPISITSGHGLSIVNPSSPSEAYLTGTLSGSGTVTITIRHLQATETISFTIDTTSSADATTGTIDGLGIRFVSVYTPGQCNVTFDPNGGEIVPPETNTKRVTYGSQYGTMPTPVWADHEFLGWYTDRTAGVRKYATTTVTTAQDHTLWAHWQNPPVSYSLSFNVNGGSGSIPTMTGTSSDGHMTFRLDAQNIPSKTGNYAFVGWAWSDSATSPDFIYTTDFEPAYVTLYDDTPVRTLYAIYVALPTGNPYRIDNGRLLVYDASTKTWHYVDDVAFVLTFEANGGTFSYTQSGDTIVGIRPPQIRIQKCKKKENNGEVVDLSIPMTSYYGSYNNAILIIPTDGVPVYVWALAYEECTEIDIQIRTETLPIQSRGISVPNGFSRVKAWEMAVPYYDMEFNSNGIATTADWGLTLTRASLDKVRQCVLRPDWLPTNVETLRAIAVATGLGSLDFGTIQGMTTTYSSKLTTIPIVCYGYTGSFCMDLGVSKSISISYTRVSPKSPNNNTSNSREWDNATWIRKLRDFTDRWQMRTNGCQLYIKRPNNTRLTNGFVTDDPMRDYIHEINGENCYITSAPIKYAVGKPYVIESTINFTMGTLYPKQTPVNMIPVVLMWGESNELPERNIYLSYPDDTAALAPSIPYSWTPIYNAGDNTYTYIFELYYYDGDGNEILLTENTYFVPVINDLTNERMIIYGRPATVTGASQMLFTDINAANTAELVPISSSVNMIVTVHMIGGGGGGGGGSNVYESAGTRRYVGSGGAGGASGVHIIRTLNVDPTGDLSVSCTLGSGGAGGASHTYDYGETVIPGEKGGNGGSTVVNIGASSYTIAGGEGGAGAPKWNEHGTWGSGTLNYESYKGGDGGTGYYSGQDNGANGTAPLGFDNFGLGGNGTNPTYYDHFGGGGGGGGAIIIQGQTGSSRGGSGNTPPSGYVMNGTLGSGGGGGSNTTSGGKGGDGVVYIMVQYGTIVANGGSP